MLCSGALTDGRIMRFDRGRGFLTTGSGSAGAGAVTPSCGPITSELLRLPADTLSFHILPSCHRIDLIIIIVQKTL